MSISQNYSTSRPSLSLNFARSKTLDPRVTFTRTSTGTYVDEDGLIKTAPAGSPRFDHDPVTGECLGLLIEEQRTNLLSGNSQNPGSTGWYGGGITTLDSTITAPDGTTGGVYYVSASERVCNFVGNGLSSVTISFFAKQRSGQTDRYRVEIYQSTDTVVNLGSQDFYFTGAIDGGAPNARFSSLTRTTYPNGWYRFSAVITTASGTFNNTARFDLEGSPYANYIWGIQIESGAFPTSYIPTTGATVTRTADNASITGSDFSSWYNPTEGTIIARARSFNLTASTYPVMAMISDGTNSNSHLISYIINNLGGAITTVGSATQSELYPSATTNPRKGSYSYKLNNFLTCFNGGTVLTDNSGLVPTSVNRMNIGQHVGLEPIYSLNGYISELIYYPTALSSSQIQTLTK